MIEILEHLSKSNLLAWNRAPYPPKYAGTYKIAAYNTVVEWQHWIVRRARAGDFMVFAARKGSRGQIVTKCIVAEGRLELLQETGCYYNPKLLRK